MVSFNKVCSFLLLAVLLCSLVTVKADYSGLIIAPNDDGDILALALLAYGSYIMSDDYLYIYSWDWNAANTSVTFTDAYMSTGEAIDSLEIESDVNVTFSMVSNRQITYSVPSNGTQTFTGVLEPASVTVDGVLTDNFTYTEATDSLIINGALSTVDIVFQFGLSVYDVVAIVIVFAMLGLAVALIYAVHNKRRDD